MVAAVRGEEAEEVLPAAFGVFEVANGVEVVKADLFEETLLSGRFVEGEEVWAEDKVERFPLLRGGALVRYKCRTRTGRNFCLSCAFMHLSASEHTIKGEATILVDWRKGVEVEVPTSDTRVDVGQSRRWRR